MVDHGIPVHNELHLPIIQMERALGQTPSGNEVYYTNSLILLVKNKPCGKLYCEEGCNSFLLL